MINSLSPDGVQNKYYLPERDIWVKMDLGYNEAVNENIAFAFLYACGFHNYAVRYAIGDNKTVSISKNFVPSGCKFIPFSEMITISNTRAYKGDGGFESRYRYILRVYNKFKVHNAHKYIKVMLHLDAFLRNTDRHLSNFGVLYNGVDYLPSPLFDNGLAFYSIEGPYFDLGNCVNGWGKVIKPWDLTVTKLEKDFINYKKVFKDFDVNLFLSLLDKRLTGDDYSIKCICHLLVTYLKVSKGVLDCRFPTWSLR